MKLPVILSILLIVALFRLTQTAPPEPFALLFTKSPLIFCIDAVCTANAPPCPFVEVLSINLPVTVPF